MEPKVYIKSIGQDWIEVTALGGIAQSYVMSSNEKVKATLTYPDGGFINCELPLNADESNFWRELQSKIETRLKREYPGNGN